MACSGGIDGDRSVRCADHIPLICSHSGENTGDHASWDLATYHRCDCRALRVWRHHRGLHWRFQTDRHVPWRVQSVSAIRCRVDEPGDIAHPDAHTHNGKARAVAGAFARAEGDAHTECHSEADQGHADVVSNSCGHGSSGRDLLAALGIRLYQNSGPDAVHRDRE